MKNNLPKKCYWCGIELTDETLKREHVPPFTFFPKGFRENLITVPSCVEHNNNYSYLDEKFQVFIKAMGTNGIAVNDFKDRVVRGLEREEKKKFVEELGNKSSYKIIDGQKNLTIEIDHDEAQLFIEKIIRGIYYYHKEEPAKGIIQSITKFIHRDALNNPALINSLKEDLDPKFMEQGYYKNPKVFNYRYQEIGEMFILVLNFYDEVEFIGWVFPESFSFEEN